jgi:hypothetical protein
MYMLVEFVKLKIAKLDRRINEAQAQRLEEVSSSLLEDLADVGDVRSMSIVVNRIEASFFLSVHKDGNLSLSITLHKRYGSTSAHHCTLESKFI